MELEECVRLISTTVGTFVTITNKQHPSKHVERGPYRSVSGRDLLGDRIVVALLVPSPKYRWLGGGSGFDFNTIGFAIIAYR